MGAGSSAHATGVPGSLDKYLPAYGALLFAIAQFASWPASNNAAIFADVNGLPATISLNDKHACRMYS